MRVVEGRENDGLDLPELTTIQLGWGAFSMMDCLETSYVIMKGGEEECC